MLTLSHDVEVPLDQFDFVRKQSAGPAPVTPAPIMGNQ